VSTLITVIGKDRKGIVAGVTAVLANSGINILDITQTVMDERFAMIMLLDMRSATEKFENVQQSLDIKGEELGVKVRWYID
jgi:ACT domain-containing protein